jgi:hypothetical protein
MFFWRKVRTILHFVGDLVFKMYAYLLITMGAFFLASFLVFLSVQNYQTCGITGNGEFSIGLYLTSSPLEVTNYSKVLT